VTDVTLRVGTGYQVLFLDPTTDTQLIAQSSAFEVKAPGSQYPLAWTLVPNFQSDILPM
jgi:hypothetical protein